MALKGQRQEFQTDLSSICNSVVSKGTMMFWSRTPGGSGIDLDDSNNIVNFLTGNTSGNFVAGMILNNFVNIDVTRQHLNFQKDELLIGSHCTLLRQGWVVTNGIVAGTSPLPGDPVYVAYSGLLTNFSNVGNYVQVHGEWMGGLDPNGYAKVAIHLP